MKHPAWLGKIARKKWDEYHKRYPALPVDAADHLALLCQSWETYLTAEGHIKENGIAQQSEGRYYVNPNCAVSRESWKQIVTMSKLLRIIIPVVDEGSDDEELEF